MEQPLILDRYRPLERIARGGYGEVVLAYDTRMQRRVAIKRLHVAAAPGRRAASATGLAEARTAAMLNHPNIVTVHEWDTDADEAFLIMEYVDGASLADLLDECGPLDLDETAAVVRAVAAALEHAHANGVLHLDIKPENVLLSHDGHVKVADFGIAALSSATGHGPAAGGTLGYMPPEQLRDEAVDERTDVWAFAALVFEMLTDANPFAADSIEGALFKADLMEAPAPTDFDPDLPDALDDVLLAALASHPAERYRSIRELADRLAPALGDPAFGHESLAATLAERFAEEDGPAAVDWERVGLWDRAPGAGAALARALGAAVAGWLAYAGLAAFGLGPAAGAGGAALAGLAGALAPGLGALLGLAILLAAAFAAGFWPVALPLAVLGAAVWWFAGRRDAAFAGTLAAPVLGLVRISPAVPLLLGFWVAPLRAAALSAFASAVTMTASAASGGRAPYIGIEPSFFADPLATRVGAGGIRVLLSTPAPLAVLLGWALAGAVMSLACARASRAAAFVGALVGGAVLWGGYATADLVSTAVNVPVTWTGEALLPYLTASLILVVLVAVAGAPPRAEEE